MEQILTEDETFTIPKGFFVQKVDLDADEPYAMIESEDYSIELPEGMSNKILIPKPLAYYLRTHFCGSEQMKNLIERNVKQTFIKEIKESLETLKKYGIDLTS